MRPQPVVAIASYSQASVGARQDEALGRRPTERGRGLLLRRLVPSRGLGRRVGAGWPGANRVPFGPLPTCSMKLAVTLEHRDHANVVLAPGRRSGPKPTGNHWKLRATAATTPQESPCKSRQSKSEASPTENRGVPGSSPGLAIAANGQLCVGLGQASPRLRRPPRVHGRSGLGRSAQPRRRPGRPLSSRITCV